MYCYQTMEQVLCLWEVWYHLIWDLRVGLLYSENQWRLLLQSIAVVLKHKDILYIFAQFMVKNKPKEETYSLHSAELGIFLDGYKK